MAYLRAVEEVFDRGAGPWRYVLNLTCGHQRVADARPAGRVRCGECAVRGLIFRSRRA